MLNGPRDEWQEAWDEFWEETSDAEIPAKPEAGSIVGPHTALRFHGPRYKSRNKTNDANEND